MTEEDETLVEYAMGFREGILGPRLPTMMCFAICAPLVTLLNMEGWKAELVEVDLGDMNHFWIRLEDGRALDPTADQFNYLWDAKMPPVYLGPPTKYQGAATPT